MAQRRPGRRRPHRRIAPAPGSAPPAAPARGGKAPGGATPTPAPADPLIGRTLARCTIESLIGRGRTSRVYRAHHAALDATVAVKVLDPRLAREKPQLLEKFQTEARAIAKIDNENVLKIYDVHSEGNLHAIVMELLEGEEILDLVTREGRVDVTDALRIARQAAHGLAAAHAHHIVHRDVKLQNLVLLEDGTVKLVDFGLAAGVGEQERVGTPHYMAPEVVRDGQAVEASDVYGLGVSLYHMLVGQPPYAGKDIPGIMRAHLEGKPLQPERARPGVPKEVAELVRSMTAADPAARPTATELVDLLDRIGGKTLQEKTTLRSRRSRGRSRAAAQRPSSATMVIAIVAVLAGVVLIVLLTRGRGGSGTSTGRTGTSPPPAATPPPTVPETPAPPPETPAAPVTPATPATPAAPASPEAEALEAARREREAQRALEAVEAWARENWHSRDDDKEVERRYREMAKQHKGTEAATEAVQRAQGIKNGTRHAHPDHTWATQDDVLRTREALDAARPEIDQLVKEHRYFAALQRVPPDVQDATGDLAAELAFFRAWLRTLADFKGTLASRVPKLPEEARTLDTPLGRGVVEELNEQRFRVRIDGVVRDVTWDQLDVQQLADLARQAFADGDGATKLQLMAYAFGHRLRDVFWDVDLDLSLSGGVPGQEDLYRAFKARVDARMAGS